MLTLEAPVDAVYGKLRSRLERAGRPIGGNDLLIAAHALAFDHTLATDSEREFSRVKDLTIENWLRRPGCAKADGSTAAPFLKSWQP